MLIAQDAGFGSWTALMRAVATGAPPCAGLRDRRHREQDRAAPAVDRREWDELLAVMKEQRITALDANGLMTDEVLARIAELDHVTRSSLAARASSPTTACCTWRACRNCSTWT